MGSLSFTKNHERLIRFRCGCWVSLSRILAQAERNRLLIPWALHRWRHLDWGMGLHQELQTQKDGPPSAGGGKNESVDFKGKQLKNDTHSSSTDPNARLYRKGSTKEARLCYQGHTLMENRNGLIVKTSVTTATGTGEREAAKAMIRQLPRTTRRITVGAWQGLRHRRLCQRTRANQCHTTCGPEQHKKEISHWRQNHRSSELQHQSENQKTDRRRFWLDEGHRQTEKPCTEELRRSPGSLISMQRLITWYGWKTWALVSPETRKPASRRIKHGQIKLKKEQHNLKQQYLNSKTNSKNQPAGWNGLKSSRFSTAC